MNISKHVHVFFFLLSLLIFLFGMLFPVQFAHPLTFIVIVFILAIYGLLKRNNNSAKSSD